MASEAPVYLTTDSSPSWRTYLYTALAVFLVGCVAGAVGYKTMTESVWLTKLHDLQAKLIKAENKPPIIKEVVKTETKTEWAYGDPKIIYVDPQTGKQVPLDIAYQFNKPEFNFTVNGKLAKFTKTDDEKFVFDKNMGKMTQTSTASIQIEVPTIDKTKRNGIGVYGSTSSAGLFVTRDSILLFGGRKWDGSAEVGVGVQLRF